MKGLISAKGYCDSGLFASEEELLFERSWRFACVLDDLAADNDYVVVPAGRKSVLIRNFKGQLRAFVNVCSHRFSQIHCEPRGNGPFRCPYHGWTYDSAGVPTGIPARPKFENLSPEVICGLALQSVALEQCGRLVFIRVKESGPSLREWMGEYFSILETMTDNMGREIGRFEMELACNWKIVVENTLEGYHIGFVHAETFAKLGLTFGDYGLHGMHSHADSPFDRQDRKNHDFLASFDARPVHTKGYYHLHIFPAFLMSTSHGIVYSVQRLDPLALDRTRLVSHLFHREPDPGAKIKPMMMGILHEAACDFNRKVLIEDQVVCESVQRAVGQTNSVGMLSDEEIRIIHFHRSWLECMGAIPTEAAKKE